MPSIVHFIWELFWKPDDEVFIQHFMYTAKAAASSFVQHLLDLIFLPYEVFSNIDAIPPDTGKNHLYKKKPASMESFHLQPANQSNH
jgi:hypothetical protein